MYPDSKVHGPHVGPIIFAIWVFTHTCLIFNGDSGEPSRNSRNGCVMTTHRILWDVITCLCPNLSLTLLVWNGCIILAQFWQDICHPIAVICQPAISEKRQQDLHKQMVLSCWTCMACCSLTYFTHNISPKFFCEIGNWGGLLGNGVAFVISISGYFFICVLFLILSYNGLCYDETSVIIHKVHQSMKPLYIVWPDFDVTWTR